jgi:uncharacterized protein
MPPRLLELARAAEFEVAISLSIIHEIQRVFREKFFWPEDRLLQFERNVSGFTIRVEPTERLGVVPSDPRDNHIVECAVAGRSEAIVTRDRDLLRLGSYEGIAMIRVRDFLRSRPR